MKVVYFLFLVSIVFVGLSAETNISVVPPYYELRYPPSTVEGELKLGVTYTLWIPPGVKVVRGIIVHQHGCGEPACKAGATAAYDLHWQALARKWHCALLGPSYHQAETNSCAWWCDPPQGSETTFLRALTDFSIQTRHRELEKVPWALWGHSGGANWAGVMFLRHPERVAAVWLRSGSPRLISPVSKEGSGEFSAVSLEVPVLCNLGAKEKQDRFAKLWESTLAFYQDFRAQGGLIGLAVDPRTSHECGDSRYLAIPWFDACLAQRLPNKINAPLRPMSKKDAWLAPVFGDTARPALAFTNDLNQSVWLPNKQVAQAWSEYVKTGAVSDTTPPPAPKKVRLKASGELTWEAAADFESGLAGFIIERDGVELVRLPQKPAGPFGRPLFQKMSYHDTPEKPLPVMRYTDVTAEPGRKYKYRLWAVNSCGMVSKPIPAIPEGRVPRVPDFSFLALPVWYRTN